MKRAAIDFRLRAQVRSPRFGPRSRPRELNPKPSQGAAETTRWTTRPSRRCRVRGACLLYKTCFCSMQRLQTVGEAFQTLSHGPLVCIYMYFFFGGPRPPTRLFSSGRPRASYAGGTVGNPEAIALGKNFQNSRRHELQPSEWTKRETSLQRTITKFKDARVE